MVVHNQFKIISIDKNNFNDLNLFVLTILTIHVYYNIIINNIVLILSKYQYQPTWFIIKNVRYGITP
jgi:hypothetical protein